MLSGVATAIKSLNPSIQVIAAEPKGADDCKRSFDARELLPVGKTNTIADGLLTSLGDNTWPIIRDLVDDVVVVSEDEIVAAMRLVWTRMKLVIEPSAAVGVAVALQDDFKRRDKLRNVAIVLCGGNVDVTKLPF